MNCDSKRTYQSKHLADTVRKARMKINKGTNLFVYQCEDCKQWHLTSSSRDWKKRKNENYSRRSFYKI
jgi:hypothetical protein